MSHIGCDTDWSRCECGWESEGVWSLEEAMQHQREHPQHKMTCQARVCPPKKAHS